MIPRWLLCLVCAASMFLSPAVARSDVAVPGYHIIPSEVILTGLTDFPTYRFVVAAVPIPRDAWISEEKRPPLPVLAREGEHVPVSSIYFQEVRAIPLDAPELVTDAWLATSHAPTSGSFTLRPLRVPVDSDEKLARIRYHARQIRSGHISLELVSAVAVKPDGSERPYIKPLNVSYELSSVQAPPGWQIYLMPSPSWPRDTPPLPAVRCEAGDILPIPPGPRTLVAVQGALGPDGSLAGKTFLDSGYLLDAWRWTELSADSKAVAYRRQIGIVVEDGTLVKESMGEIYQDAEGRWFEDEEMTFPVSMSYRWWWAAGGGAIVLMVLGAWALRRRLRAR